MIVILGLNKRITPQYYRNYFILKMLGHTNNNINLVSKKMGVSNQTILNNFINNFEIEIKDALKFAQNSSEPLPEDFEEKDTSSS